MRRDIMWVFVERVYGDNIHGINIYIYQYTFLHIVMSFGSPEHRVVLPLDRLPMTACSIIRSYFVLTTAVATTRQYRLFSIYNRLNYTRNATNTSVFVQGVHYTILEILYNTYSSTFIIEYTDYVSTRHLI